MVRCKGHELPRRQVRFPSAAAMKGSRRAADGRFSRAPEERVGIPLRGGWCEMVRCNGHDFLGCDAYVRYVAATKDSCNAAEDRFPTAP